MLDQLEHKQFSKQSEMIFMSFLQAIPSAEMQLRSVIQVLADSENGSSVI